MAVWNRSVGRERPDDSLSAGVAYHLGRFPVITANYYRILAAESALPTNDIVADSSALGATG